MTMRFVASFPVGAPFAMSTDGAVARSLRAPATPSCVGRPCTGSISPGCWIGPATLTGVPHVVPPLVERTMNSNGWCWAVESVPTPNTYATPWLSVRIVHPSSGLRCPVLAAGVTCWSDQLSPPSREAATINGAGTAWPFSCPLKLAQQTYTFPKNGLLCALSAQICSLSLKVVDD